MARSLTEEELESMPLGSTVFDSDGDELTRVQYGWEYAHFDHPALTPGELALYYSPVRLEWELQDMDLWDFADIYGRMTAEEQKVVSAIVAAVQHRPS